MACKVTSVSFDERPPAATAESSAATVEQSDTTYCPHRAYDRVAVLLVTWDYDGGMNSEDDSDRVEKVFRKYGFVIFRAKLPCSREKEQPVRNNTAHDMLHHKCKDLRNSFGGQKDLIIFHYRGDATTCVVHPGELLLSSGTFRDELNHADLRTIVGFQNAIHSIDNFDTPVNVIFLMDCPHADRAVYGHKCSLVAASAPSVQPQSRELGFNDNLIDVLRIAHDDRDWLTVYQLLRRLMYRYQEGRLAGKPIWTAEIREDGEEGDTLIRGFVAGVRAFRFR